MIVFSKKIAFTRWFHETDLRNVSLIIHSIYLEMFKYFEKKLLPFYLEKLYLVIF